MSSSGTGCKCVPELGSVRRLPDSNDDPKLWPALHSASGIPRLGAKESCSILCHSPLCGSRWILNLSQPPFVPVCEVVTAPPHPLQGSVGRLKKGKKHRAHRPTSEGRTLNLEAPGRVKQRPLVPRTPTKRRTLAGPRAGRRARFKHPANIQGRAVGSRCLQTTQTQQLAAPCTPEQVLQLAGPLGQRRHWDQAEDGTLGVRQACGTSPARGPYSPVCSFLSPRFLPRETGTTRATQQGCVQNLSTKYKV